MPNKWLEKLNKPGGHLPLLNPLPLISPPFDDLKLISPNRGNTVFQKEKKITQPFPDKNLVYTTHFSSISTPPNKEWILP